MQFCKLLHGNLAKTDEISNRVVLSHMRNEKKGKGILKLT